MAFNKFDKSKDDENCKAMAKTLDERKFIEVRKDNCLIIETITWQNLYENEGTKLSLYNNNCPDGILDLLSRPQVQTQIEDLTKNITTETFLEISEDNESSNFTTTANDDSMKTKKEGGFGSVLEIILIVAAAIFSLIIVGLVSYYIISNRRKISECCLNCCAKKQEKTETVEDANELYGIDPDYDFYDYYQEGYTSKIEEYNYQYGKDELNMDEFGVKHNNAIDNVHEEEVKDSKSEHRFYFELSTFK